MTLAKEMIGSQVIVRTYSAGVWYGTLAQKEGAHSADGDGDGCIAVYFAIQERTQHATA